MQRLLEKNDTSSINRTEEIYTVYDWVIKLDKQEMDEIALKLNININNIRRKQKIKIIDYIHNKLGINEKVTNLPIWFVTYENEYKLYYTSIPDNYKSMWL